MPITATRPRVWLVPHDGAWASLAARESALLRDRLDGVLLEVQHIGSTAIPGIHAKPIIDLLAVVRELPALDARAEELELLGYEAMGEFGIAGRRYFRKDDAAGIRTHQVHAFAAGSPQIERHLAFRDYLRAHPAEAARYSDLKLSLAAAHPDDLPRYTDGKDDFIRDIDAKAAQWRAKQLLPA